MRNLPVRLEVAAVRARAISRFLALFVVLLTTSSLTTRVVTVGLAHVLHVPIVLGSLFPTGTPVHYAPAIGEDPPHLAVIHTSVARHRTATSQARGSRRGLYFVLRV